MDCNSLTHSYRRSQKEYRSHSQDTLKNQWPLLRGFRRIFLMYVDSLKTSNRFCLKEIDVLCGRKGKSYFKGSSFVREAWQTSVPLRALEDGQAKVLWLKRIHHREQTAITTTECEMLYWNSNFNQVAKQYFLLEVNVESPRKSVWMYSALIR